MSAEEEPRFVHSVSTEDKHVAGRKAYKAVLTALAQKEGG